MKIALVTDTHWGARNDNSVFSNYFAQFFKNQFFPYLKANNITRIIHLGDVVDRRKYINYQTHHSMMENFFKPIIENNIQLDVIVGNHDTYFKNTNHINSMEQLFGSMQIPNIRWYDNEPGEIEVDECKIFLLPWLCTNNVEKFMDAVANTKAQVLMGHLELQGFELLRGSVCDHGQDPVLFNKFDIVCSGHFHHKSSSGNIHYLGTPYELTWSDYNDPRGFHVFDTKTRHIEFIHSPLTMFNKIFYDDVNLTIDEITKIDFRKYKNTFVKVIVKQKTNPYWFDLYIEKLEKVGLTDVQVVEDHLNLNLEGDDDIVNEAEDTMTILKKYIDSIEIDTDKQRLDKLIRSLYDEALSVE